MFTAIIVLYFTLGRA
jgi:hypothetical protein